jgi:hypothetical protein
LLEDARAITEYCKAKALAEVHSSTQNGDIEDSEEPLPRANIEIVANEGSQAKKEEPSAGADSTRTTPTRESPQPPSLFFKDSAIVKKKLDEQLKHVLCIADERRILLFTSKNTMEHFTAAAETARMRD